MRKIVVTFKGVRVDASSIIEKSKETIEKMGIDLDSLDDQEALFVAASVNNATVPELLGF